MKKFKNNNIILGFSFQFYVFGFSLSNGFDIKNQKTSYKMSNINVVQSY